MWTHRQRIAEGLILQDRVAVGLQAWSNRNDDKTHAPRSCHLEKQAREKKEKIGMKRCFLWLAVKKRVGKRQENNEMTVKNQGADGVKVLRCDDHISALMKNSLENFSSKHWFRRSEMLVILYLYDYQILIKIVQKSRISAQRLSSCRKSQPRGRKNVTFSNIVSCDRRCNR